MYSLKAFLRHSSEWNAFKQHPTMCRITHSCNHYSSPSLCAPFFPMMAPTAWVGMKRLTISCSGYWKDKTRQTPSFPCGLPPQALPITDQWPGATWTLCRLGHCRWEAGGMNLNGGCTINNYPTARVQISVEQLRIHWSQQAVCSQAFCEVQT